MTRNIIYIIKALTGMSFLRMMCIESDMTRQFYGTKVDFIAPMLTKSSWNTSLVPDLQVIKEVHVLASLRALKHSRDLKKRRIHPVL